MLGVIYFFVQNSLKSKTTTLFILLCALLVVISLLLSGVDIVVKHKLFINFLLTTQSYMLHLVALFYAYDLLFKDRVLGAFVIPISSGLSRDAYLLSLMLSLLFLVGILFTIFFCINTISFIFILGEIRFELLLQLFLYFLSASMLAMFTILFSLYVSLFNSLIYSVILFFIGNSLDELLLFASKGDFFEKVSLALYYLIPNFSLFDFQSEVVSNLFIPYYELLAPIVYFVAIFLLIYTLASRRYKTKVLDVGF